MGQIYAQRGRQLLPVAGKTVAPWAIPPAAAKSQPKIACLPNRLRAPPNTSARACAGSETGIDSNMISGFLAAQQLERGAHAACHRLCQWLQPGVADHEEYCAGYGGPSEVHRCAP